MKKVWRGEWNVNSGGSLGKKRCKKEKGLRRIRKTNCIEEVWGGEEKGICERKKTENGLKRLGKVWRWQVKGGKGVNKGRKVTIKEATKEKEKMGKKIGSEELK